MFILRQKIFPISYPPLENSTTHTTTIVNIFLRFRLINFRLNRTTVGDFFWIIFHIVVTGRVVMSSILYSIFWSFRSVFRIQVEFGSIREKFLADLTVWFRRIWAWGTEVTRQQKIVNFSTRLQLKVKKSFSENVPWIVVTVKDFLIKLDIKPLMHLLKISIFSL